MIWVTEKEFRIDKVDKLGRRVTGLKKQKKLFSSKIRYKAEEEHLLGMNPEECCHHWFSVSEREYNYLLQK